MRLKHFSSINAAVHLKVLIFAPETTHHELNRINETTTLPLPALTGSYNALCPDAFFGKHEDDARQHEDPTRHDYPLAQLPM